MKEKQVKVGENFEKRLAKVFVELRKDNVAYIVKIPTEMKLIRGAGGRIVNAFPVKDEDNDNKLLDFHGWLRNGKSICIEAKSCKNKTSFPFSNFKPYQLPLLEYLVHSYSIIGYIIIEMRELKRVFLFDGITFIEFMKHCGKKSINIKEMEEIGIEIDYDLQQIKNHIKSLTNN